MIDKEIESILNKIAANEPNSKIAAILRANENIRMLREVARSLYAEGDKDSYQNILNVIQLQINNLLEGIRKDEQKPINNQFVEESK